jgi:beta-N-acetylhexosaminidase
VSAEDTFEGITEQAEEQPDAMHVRAMEIAASLDSRQLAAQVIMAGIDGRGRLTRDMRLLLGECPAGAVIFFRYNLNTGNRDIQNLTGECVTLITGQSGIAPFIAVDHEGGTVNRFNQGVAVLPPASSYWERYGASQETLRKIEEDSFNAARELSALGFNFNLAPVAEYQNSYNRDFLKSRVYSPNPFFTAQAAAAFIRGMENAGVLCAVKHFPASAGADPHLYASVLPEDMAGLETLVFPFASLFSGGARAVMVAHSYIPEMDTVISSLSRQVMGRWLRDEMGFTGLIVCDDFSMAAASGAFTKEQAAVMSVAAGSDMVIVWPPDLRKTHLAFLAALEDGSLPPERLLDAAARVILEKLRLGLIE